MTIFAAVSLLLVGCSSSPAPSAPATQATTPVTQSATPPAAVAVQKPGTPTPPPAQTKKGTKRTIASRRFQLNDLEVVKIKVAGKEFNCWVMDTDNKMEEGMMYLEESDVADNECMIFVFGDEQPLSFWMRNTRIDLDIAYLNEAHKIVSIRTMKAYDESPVPSKKPAMYAIEFKSGTLKKIGAKEGQIVEMPKTLHFKLD